MAKHSNQSSGLGSDTPVVPLGLFDAAPIGAEMAPGNEVPETGAAPSQIVFIEGDVPDAEVLARGVTPGVRVVLLDPSLDGVRQIADYLTSHDIQNLAAIDIVSHGADGLLELGSTELNAATIGQYQGELAAIGAALQLGGAIQLYGCDVAQDAAGDAFLQQLSQATGGANIAAASHLVGAADEGGSWTLNVNVGTVTAADPFTATTQAAYPDVLPAVTDKIIFLSSNDQAGSAAVGTRVEQISAQGGTFVAGSTVDIADGSQSKDSGLATTPSGFAVDTAQNEYFVAVDNPNTHALTIQKGTPLAAGSTLTTFYTIPLQDFTGSGSTVASIGQLALNPLAGELYYAQDGVDENGNAVPAETGIFKVSINGGTPVLLTPSSNSLFNPNAIALDVPANLLFFTDAYDSNESGGAFPSVNDLDVANLNTGSITVLMSFTTQSSSDPGFLLGGLAVDPVNHEIYLTSIANFETNTSTNNAIYKISFTPTGSGNSANASIGSISTLYSGTGAFQPNDIAIDPAQNIFYTSGGSIVSSGTTIGAIYQGSLSNNDTGSLSLVAPLTSIVAGGATGPAENDIIPQLDVLTSPTVTTSGTVSAISGGGSVTADSGAAVTEQDGQLLTGATVSGVLTGDTLSFNGGSPKIFTDGFTISSSFSSGTLTLSGNASAADYQSALDAVTFSSTSSNAAPRTLNWAVSDADFTSATSTSTADVRVAPTVAAAGTVTFNGGGSAVTLDSGLTVSDASSTTLISATVIDVGFVNGDTLSVGTLGGLGSVFSNGTLTLSGAASLAVYQTALDSVKFSFSPGNGDPTGGGSHTSRTIDWTVNDGSLVSNTGISRLNVVHTAPTVTAGATATFTGGGGAVVLDSGIAISDVDSGGVLSSATITVAGAITGDTLNFTNINSTTEGNISVVSDSGGVLKLTSSGSTATLAQWQTALSSVTYSFSPSDGDPTNGGGDTSRTIDWSVNDGVRNSGTVTSTLDVVHVAPAVTASGTVSYSPLGTAAVLDATLTASDPDSGGNLTGATIKISSGFTTGDMLNFSTQNGITEISFNNGTLSLAGTASISNYETALRSITYSSSLADPTVGGTDDSRTITWMTTDGAASSAAATS